jgi:hypothetical protein
VILRAAVGLIFVCAVFYGVDYAAAKNRPLGSVLVQPYYAVHQKNGKIEFDYSTLPPEQQSCVASALPHLGMPPCWYLNGHKQKKIEI